MSKSIWEFLFENWPAKILSLLAAVLIFLFFRMSSLEERSIFVPLDFKVQEQFIPSGNFPRIAKVTLRGNKDSIYLISEKDLEVFLDLRTINTEGNWKGAVQVVKKGSARHVDSLEVRVDPLEVTLYLERKIIREIPVFPDFSEPQRGYNLTQYFISPPTAIVEGPKSFINDLEVINTEKIDISALEDNFTLRAGLISIDPSVTFMSLSEIEVKGFVEEKILLKTFKPVDIISLDLDPGFTLKIPSADTQVKVQGSQLQLENVKPEEVRLIVDCSGIKTPGAYTLNTRADLPQGLLVLKYEPREIIIEVIKKREE